MFGSSTGGSGIRFASQLAHVKTPPNLQNEPVKILVSKILKIGIY